MVKYSVTSLAKEDPIFLLGFFLWILFLAILFVFMHFRFPFLRNSEGGYLFPLRPSLSTHLFYGVLYFFATVFWLYGIQYFFPPRRWSDWLALVSTLFMLIICVRGLLLSVNWLKNNWLSK